MIGKILGARYQIQDKIGDGGMAIVYKGTDTLLGRTVTIKILRENLAGDADVVRSFRREAHAAASLSHPNIVNVYDVGREEDIYYIVMEYIDGKSLKELIVEEGKLSSSQTVDIAAQICEALQDAHRHNIIHRDIKPHNILINREGRVKVTDFGIARAVTTVTVTYTQSIVGSVHYFSPEQAKGGAAHGRSDIYSLGIVMYEMLTGSVPFSGDTPVSVALKHVQEEVPHPSDINTDIPVEVEEVIMKAVAKDPVDRYETAEELLGDLQELQKHIREHGPLSWEKKKRQQGAVRKKNKNGKFNRKHMYIALVVVAFMAILLTGFFLLRSALTVPEVEVPLVEGLTLEQGSSKLREEGLTFTVEQVPSRDVPAGHIISQDPQAGRKVRQERNVNLVLSTGPSYVHVPGVIGKTELEASITLQAADLEIDKEEEHSNDVAAGIVMNQVPGEGARLLKGETVKVIVSKGGQPVKLKDLRGLILDDAKRWLETYNLVLRDVRQLSDLAPEGQVIKQFPDPEEVLQMGDSVDLVVSSGPDMDQLQKYSIRVEIPPDRLEIGEEVEIVIEDVLGEHWEVVEYVGEVIVVEGYGEGFVAVLYKGEELAKESFPQ